MARKLDRVEPRLRLFSQCLHVTARAQSADLCQLESDLQVAAEDLETRLDRRFLRAFWMYAGNRPSAASIWPTTEYACR